jgi:hypothetical protein
MNHSQPLVVRVFGEKQDTVSCRARRRRHGTWEQILVIDRFCVSTECHDRIELWHR